METYESLPPSCSIGVHATMVRNCMILHNVLKTIYIDNGDNDFLKYEIMGEHGGDVTIAIVSAEIKSVVGGIECYLWAKVGELTFEYLDPPKRGSFQQTVAMESPPGRSISTVMRECKKHRATWQRP